MDSNAQQWKFVEYSTPEELDMSVVVPLLASNKIAGVRIAGFYSEAENQETARNILKAGIQWYPGFESRQGRIGLCATEYHSKPDGRKKYFAAEPEHTARKKELFGETGDPAIKLLDLFGKTHKTEIAREPDLGDVPYFVGLVRAMQDKSTTHFDFAPHQLPGWWVSGVENQFSAVMYFQTPDTGGELTAFQRLWQENDDVHNEDMHEKGPKGFDASFLAGVNSATMMPSPGDLILFNSRNFHQVEGVDSSVPRLSSNVFFGNKQDTLYLWD